MSDVLVLTFAELDFVLRTGTPAVLPVHEQLRMRRLEDTTTLAGVASLLARGLCTLSDEQDVLAGPEVVTAAAALTGADLGVSVYGWVDGAPTLVHLFAGPELGISVTSAGYGRFALHRLDPAVPIEDQVQSVLAAVTAADGDAVCLVQISRPGDRTGIVLARQAEQWYVSDSDHSPDRGEPTTLQAALGRIRELLGAVDPAGAVAE